MMSEKAEALFKLASGLASLEDLSPTRDLAAKNIYSKCSKSGRLKSGSLKSLLVCNLNVCMLGFWTHKVSESQGRLVWR